jgi:hypothetical protein
LKTKKLIFFFYWKWKVGGTMKKWKLINNLLIAHGDISCMRLWSVKAKSIRVEQYM